MRNTIQKEYLENDDFVINVNIMGTEAELFKKCDSSSLRMKEITINYVGIVTGDNKRFISHKRIDSRYKEILVGEDLEKYGYSFNSRYVLFDKEQLWSNTDESVFELPEKILLRKTGNTLIACLDSNQLYTEQTIYNLFPKADTGYSLRFILAILNSQFVQYYFYNKLITNPKAYPYIKGIHINLFPIHHISFVAPKKERKRLITEAKNHYENMLKPGNQIPSSPSSNPGW